MSYKVLVTGGCGYIGSHVCRQLSAAGHEVIVFDNLSTGYAEALVSGERLIEGDLSNLGEITDALMTDKVDAVLHFAASISVSESVKNPISYYQNNTANSLNLLTACLAADVDKFVFSSTAAVYGNTDHTKVTEKTPLNPMSPYAKSKLMVEWKLQDLDLASDLRYVALRYFNVAGAMPEYGLGPRNPEAKHLIKVCCQAAIDNEKEIEIFGCDYPTKDGTGVRDYIHVEDLAAAHIAALEYLFAGNKSTTLNCGYGTGFSVLDVISEVQRQCGRQIPVRHSPRRLGDIASMVADNTGISKQMNWLPQYNTLEKIVESSRTWESMMYDESIHDTSHMTSRSPHVSVEHYA